MRLCNSQVAPPQGCTRDAEYIFDMHLVNWVSKDCARIAGDDGDVYKIVITEADSWETPRPPFEVGHPADGCSFCVSTCSRMTVLHKLSARDAIRHLAFCILHPACKLMRAP